MVVFKYGDILGSFCNILTGEKKGSCYVSKKSTTIYIASLGECIV